MREVTSWTTEDREFVRMVCYFWRNKGDPTRYVDWDPARCERLMPMFYRAWRDAEFFEKVADRLARDAQEAAGDE